MRSSIYDLIVDCYMISVYSSYKICFLNIKHTYTHLLIVFLNLKIWPRWNLPPHHLRRDIIWTTLHRTIFMEVSWIHKSSFSITWVWYIIWIQYHLFPREPMQYIAVFCYFVLHTYRNMIFYIEKLRVWVFVLW